MKFKLINWSSHYLLNPVYSIFLFTDFLVLIKVFGVSARLTVVYLAIILFLVNLKIKNLITSSLLVSIFAFQFYIPNKYYAIEVLKSIQTSPNLGSYVLSYGVNLQNLFIVLTAILIFRKLFLNKKRINLTKIKYVIPIILSAFLYFAVSLYSSAFYSPHSTLSLVWLSHFMQLFIVALSILYTRITDSKNFHLITTVLTVSLILQAIIGVLQFLNQSWVGLPVENFRSTSTYYGAVDAVDSIFRIAGTFGHPNQLGLILMLMITIIIPTAINKNKIIEVFGVVLGILAVLLTQSRSTWMGLFVVLLLTISIYKSELVHFIKYIGIRRVVISAFVLLSVTSFVVIPRLIRSLNALNTGGSVPLRVEMIKEADEAISLRPLVGYGIGTNEITLYNLFPNGYNYGFPAPVHNGYIQIILESGILGLVFLFFPYIFILRKSIMNITNKSLLYKQNKNFMFSYISGVCVFSIFYVFLPHEGIREFSYLGIILGYGLVGMYLPDKNKL